MHKNTKYRLTAASLLVLVAASYALLRIHATQVADKDIDSFFASFNNPISQNADRTEAETPEKIKEVISWHREALKNYNYSDLTPHLNFMLDETRVEVSWHLTIIFSKHGGRWFPTLYDAYDSEKQTHNHVMDPTRYARGS